MTRICQCGTPISERSAFCRVCRSLQPRTPDPTETEIAAMALELKRNPMTGRGRCTPGGIWLRMPDGQLQDDEERQIRQAMQAPVECEYE
jgi:hypothetical protein